MATLESVIQKINLLIEDANDTTGSLHNNLRDAVDSLILGYGNVEVDSLSNLHAWSKYTIGGTIIEEPVTDIQLFYKLASSSTKFELDYADSYEIVDNAISLVNPTTITLGRDNESRNAIKGKYVKRGNVYYIPTDARVAYGNYTNYKTIEVDKATKITYIASDSEFVGIVVSEDSNAYPQNGEQDGYKYVYNGTLDNVSVPVLQDKNVTPSASQQVVKPDSNYDGLSQVTVAGDADLLANNIRKGVEIFGVTGSYEAAGVTTLPTLTNPGTADDLAKDKQFIDANGNVVTGTVATTIATVATTKEATEVKRMATASTPRIAMNRTFDEPLLVRAGDTLGLYSDATNFGDASASDVAKGKTFTSENGVKIVGIREDDGGVTLPTLTNPASASDMASGKQLIDSNGNVVTGNIQTNEPAEGTGGFAAITDPAIFLSYPGSGPTLNISAKVGRDILLRNGSRVVTRAPLTEFGDATAADVLEGKTFTSAEGLKVVGTMAPSSFTVTDDGAGNVTITSSAITDNDGDVVIA